MKILSLSTSVWAKGSLVLLLAIFILVGMWCTAVSPKSSQTESVYHQSEWNEYAPQIDRALSAESNVQPTGLAHVYGMVVSHHIPTTIPRLVEFYSRLKQGQTVNNFIVIGPDHTDAGQAPITVSNASFFTAYGEVKPIEGLASKLEAENVAHIEEKPFDPEHSVGSQILVISKIFPGARVTPIILRSDTPKDYAEALGRTLSEYLDDNTVLIASVDFSHYLSTGQAMPIDEISGSIVRDLNLSSLSLAKADSPSSLATFIEAMIQKNAIDVGDFIVLNTNDLMQNSDFTTGYIFGYWGKK